MSQFIKPCLRAGCRLSCLTCPEAKDSTSPQAFQTVGVFIWEVQKWKGVSKQAVETRDSLHPGKKPEYMPCSSPAPPSPERCVCELAGIQCMNPPCCTHVPMRRKCFFSSSWRQDVPITSVSSHKLGKSERRERGREQKNPGDGRRKDRIREPGSA